MRTVRRRQVSAWVVGLLLLGLVSCGAGTPAEPVPRARLAVLFIGNSLTATNDLPALVAGLARRAGLDSFRYQQVTAGGFSLEDHWSRSNALDAIASGDWDVVVLQQGPSALPSSRENLVEWAGRFAERIRAAGARPALYMVWPPLGGDWSGVSASYSAAALAVDGFLLPAGEAWRAVSRDRPDIALYGADNFHPTQAGSYLAALVIVAGLTERGTAGLSRDAPLVDISPLQAEVLEHAADAAVRDFGLP